MSDLQSGDDLAASVAVAPRVSLADIEAAIDSCYYLNAFAAVVRGGVQADSRLRPLTLCILVLKNGFTIVGKSAPASPENFDQAVGEQFAREDAVRQVWSFEGYALKDRLAREAAPI